MKAIINALKKLTDSIDGLNRKEYEERTTEYLNSTIENLVQNNNLNELLVTKKTTLEIAAKVFEGKEYFDDYQFEEINDTSDLLTARLITFANLLAVELGVHIIPQPEILKVEVPVEVKVPVEVRVEVPVEVPADTKHLEVLIDNLKYHNNKLAEDNNSMKEAIKTKVNVATKSDVTLDTDSTYIDTDTNVQEQFMEVNPPLLDGTETQAEVTEFEQEKLKGWLK